MGYSQVACGEKDRERKPANARCDCRNRATHIRATVNPVRPAAENTLSSRERRDRHELADGLRLYTREGASRRPSERGRVGEKAKNARRRPRGRERQREKEGVFSCGITWSRTHVKKTSGKKTTRLPCHRARACMCTFLRIRVEMIMHASGAAGKEKRKKRETFNTDIHTQKCVFFFFLAALIFSRPAFLLRNHYRVTRVDATVVGDVAWPGMRGKT